MLDDSAPDFVSIDITFMNSKPGLKVAFKGRANILLLALFTTYKIHILNFKKPEQKNEREQET